MEVDPHHVDGRPTPRIKPVSSRHPSYRVFLGPIPSASKEEGFPALTLISNPSSYLYNDFLPQSNVDVSAKKDDHFFLRSVCITTCSTRLHTDVRCW